MVDNGYDVLDFKDIDFLFGNMNDFDEFFKEIYVRGMKVMLDFVFNYILDQYFWFLESRFSIYSFKRDWYVWFNFVVGGGFFNNWVSVFGGSVWSYDVKIGQYYLYQFCVEQLDFNFRNIEVR